MLASIQRVKSVKHHPNGHSLDIVQILGWSCITRRDEFKEGDLVVYIQIDTVLPEAPWCEFMRNKKFRVQSVRLRKELSQGLVFSTDIIKNHRLANSNSGVFSTERVFEGLDVTEILGVKKYEKPLPRNSDALGGFPTSIIQITDEERIQNIPDIVDYLQGKEVDISLKHDGTSFTYIREGEFKGEKINMVCSRRQVLKPGENVYWKMVEKYKLENIPAEMIIQGEICGPKIQGNKEGLKEHVLYVFNAFSQKKGFLNPCELKDFCGKYNFTAVTHLFSGKFHHSLQSLLDFSSQQRYNNGSPAEGIVVRASNGEHYLGKPLSFKVISNKFLLKYKE